MSKGNWTAADEALLQEMKQRKADFLTMNFSPLRQFVYEHMVGLFIRTDMVDEMADWLAKNAETIRDLLQPFDSGVRVAPDTTNNKTEQN